MTANFSDAYAKAGVNTAEGARAVDLIKPLIKSTWIPGVISDIGDFSGEFELTRYVKDLVRPVLSKCTDGVGTKMEIARQMQRWHTVGIDCVAMCVNDLICSGARPITLVDYIACGKNEPEVIHQIITGIAKGCRQSNIALLGGEMAEHPGTMEVGQYDLSGTACGIVDLDSKLGPHRVQVGDTLIGLASNGIHSNGFSLIRKVFNSKHGDAQKWLALKLPIPATRRHYRPKTIGHWLMKPTRIYVASMTQVIKHSLVKSASHITGGGLYENIPRMLPDDLAAHINLSAWPHHDIDRKVFEFISTEGQISEYDMFNTFNMGIGMVIAVSRDESPRVLKLLKKQGEQAYVIGEIIERGADPQITFSEEPSRDRTFKAVVI